MAGFMRVNYKLVYVGVFLFAIGAMLVAADLGSIANDALVQVLRLWPLALIAVGLGLALRKTRIGFGTGMLAAAMPGLLLGGAFAAAPRLPGSCTGPGDGAPAYVQAGSFDNVPIDVSVSTGCGSLDLSIDQQSAGWRLAAVGAGGRVPHLSAGPTSLSIASGAGGDWPAFADGRDAWTVTLPGQTTYGNIDVEANANRANLDLANAQIRRLAIDGNAAVVTVDASAAFLDQFDARIKLGELWLLLPAASDVTANIRMAAGHALICVPPGVGIRATFSGQLRDVTINGLKETGTNWESADFETAKYHASVSVRADVGGIEINPIGGCS